MKPVTAEHYRLVHTAVREAMAQYSSYFEPTDGWDVQMEMSIVERVMDLVVQWQYESPVQNE